MDEVDGFFADIERRQQAARERADEEQRRIGARVRRARRNASQAAVVRALDEEHGLMTSTRALSQIETGARSLKLAEAVALASIYGVHIEAFTQDEPGDVSEASDRARADELERIREYIDARLDIFTDRNR
jgi:hypothetical protein